MRLRISLFVWCCCISLLEVVAQHTLQVKASAEKDHQLLKNYSYNPKPEGSEAAEVEIKELLSALRADGYLLADTISVFRSKDSIIALLEAGKQFRWARLEQGNVEPELLRQTLYRRKLFDSSPFSYVQVTRLMEQILRVSENGGYPFAAVQLDSIALEENVLQASLALDKGPFIVFDTLEQVEKQLLRPKFLSVHTGIRPGEPYSQQKLEQVADRLRQLPYIKLQDVPHVSFQNNQATLHVELEARQANRIDGIIGLVPDAQQAGRYLLTGQFDLLLQNPFRTGKRIELHWQRLNKASQNLEVAYFHPYVLKSPVSVALGFELLKEAEAFVNRQLRVEAQLQQGPYNTISLLLQQKDARLLGEAAGKDYASFQLQQYGLGYSRHRLDSWQLPRRGYEFSAEATAGRKKIRSLPPGVEDDSSSIQAGNVNMQYRAGGRFAYYQPLGQQWVLAHQLEAGLMADEQLFLNDLYRLGGLNSLRGFREKSFFASDYALSRLELRWLAGASTYFFGFYDQAWMQYSSGNLHLNDWPLGLGAGLNLGTNAGTFNFIYGLGSMREQPLGFAHSQVHFGYINRF